jgi:hypothetical protein
MVKDCRLRLFANAYRNGWAERVAAAAAEGSRPDSAGESVMQVDCGLMAGARGRIMRRCLDVSKILEMSAGALALRTSRFPGPEQNEQ